MGAEGCRGHVDRLVKPQIIPCIARVLVDGRVCALRGWLCDRLEGVKKRFAQVHQGECPVIPLEPLSGALSAPGAAQLGRQGYASPLRALDVAGRPGSLAPARVAPGGMTETRACF